jgi:hypothetical protein
MGNFMWKLRKMRLRERDELDFVVVIGFEVGKGKDLLLFTKMCHKCRIWETTEAKRTHFPHQFTSDRQTF